MLTQAKKLGDDLEARKADLAASTQAAIVEVLVKKSLAALEQTGLNRAGGGRRRRRQPLAARAARMPRARKRGVRVHYPELHLCTDNGAMIAMAAAMRLQAGVASGHRGLRLRREAALAARALELARTQRPRIAATGRIRLAGRRLTLICESCATLLTGTFLASVSVSTPFSSLAPLAVDVDVLRQLVGGLELALALGLGLDADHGAFDVDGQLLHGRRRARRASRSRPCRPARRSAPLDGGIEEGVVDEALEAAVEGTRARER